MKEVILLMDVGGTHTRSRLVRAGQDMLRHPGIIIERSAAISDKAGLLDFINEMLAGQDRAVVSSVLSFAGPVMADRVAMTNWRQLDEISLAELQMFGLAPDRTMLINDMEAAALCLIAYKTGALDLQTECLYAASEGVNKHFNNAILIIPGTGVGVAGVVVPGKHGDPATPAPVSCELQHTLIPYLGDAYADLVEALQHRLARKLLTWEDIVSGKGLENVYHCLHLAGNESGAYDSNADAAEIARRAVDGGDKLCEAALDFYYYTAGAMTQVVALAFQPFAGVYLGGGTTAQNIPFIRHSSYVDGLQENAIRKGLLQSFPVYLVPEYMNLNGTLYLASQGYK